MKNSRPISQFQEHKWELIQMNEWIIYWNQFSESSKQTDSLNEYLQHYLRII